MTTPDKPEKILGLIVFSLAIISVAVTAFYIGKL